jgi:uncharacterized protein (TIGR00255 family)
MYSMTASANVSGVDDSASWQWEIRSVNQRFLEFNFRLPDALRHLEMPLRQRAKRVIERGKLDISLKYQTNAPTQPLQLNPGQLADLSNAIEQIQARFPEATHLNPLEMLQWPGIVQPPTIEQPFSAGLLTDFDSALVQLNQARAQEGDTLAQLIAQRLAAMREQLAQLRPLMSDILAQQRQRLANKLAELAVQVDEQRLAAEIVLLAQKADIDEELDRLSHHLNEVERVIRQPGAIGRRLDFLMQELNREANTLGSKSIDTRTTEVSVELKVLIEQMREQVQNIE